MKLPKFIKYFLVSLVILVITIVGIIASMPFWDTPPHLGVVLHTKLLQLLGRKLQSPSFEVFVKIDKENSQYDRTSWGENLRQIVASPVNKVKVGERIQVRPFLLYQGNHLLSIYHALPLLHVNIYSEEEKRVVKGSDITIFIAIPSSIKPNTPFYGEKREGRISFYGKGDSYSFTFDQPGKYYVSALAEFGIRDVYGEITDRWKVYSQPISIEVVED